MKTAKTVARRVRAPGAKTARDVMSRDVICVPSTMLLPELAATLSSRHVSGVGVVDDSGVLIGAVSSSDLAARAGQPRSTELAIEPAPEVGRAYEDCSGAEATVSFEGTIGPLETTRVADVYSRFVVSAPVDAELSTLAGQMVRHRVHRLFITDDGVVAGVVTSMDLMRAMAGDTGRPARRSVT